MLGVGIGLFLTSNWALAIQHAPLEQAAKYMGLTNLATAGAGALSRLQGPLIDGLNAALRGRGGGIRRYFYWGQWGSRGACGCWERSSHQGSGWYNPLL